MMITGDNRNNLGFVSLFPPQTSQGMPWDRTRDFETTGRPITVRGRARSLTCLGVQTFAAQCGVTHG
jgi:hypothetical protein